MATNEILPFASTNTGTNLLTQAEYAADAQRVIGHQPGIARSKLENKALRQASLMAAGLAEFIADYQANNVTDSLTAQQVADYLLAAITANIPVVPDASTTVKGKIEIATASEAQAYSSSLLAVTPATMNQALKGANQSLNQNGYQKLPGDMILQWGRVELSTAPSDSFTGAVTYPIAFPSVVLNIVLGDITGTSNPDGFLFVDFTNSQPSRTGFQWRSGSTLTVNSTLGLYWLAIGY